MWKLTIAQKRKSESSDYTFEEKVAYVSSNLDKLLSLVALLASCKEEQESSYKIEKVEEGKEE